MYEIGYINVTHYPKFIWPINQTSACYKARNFLTELEFLAHIWPEHALSCVHLHPKGLARLSVWAPCVRSHESVY